MLRKGARMFYFKSVLYFLFLLFFTSCTSRTGNVIFFHPDGMSLAHWDAVRLVQAGPDGLLAWDKMTNMAVYRGHTKKYLGATSNAGATIHAYGIRVGIHSFGMDNGKPILSASGKSFSIMTEAKKRGFSVALCQSGILVEPGTAVFVAQSENRKNFNEISLQVIKSGADLLFGGGEKFLLPKGVKGYFGEGVREDGKNLIEWAKTQGYHVVYTREEMRLLPKTVDKVLGVFAYENTYNDKSREEQIKEKLPHYLDSAPSIAEMTEWTLQFLKKKKKKFLLVVEEEGTDNFSNKNNAEGFFVAGQRSDQVVAVVNRFLKTNPLTLFLTTSDSNASGLLIADGHPRKRWRAKQYLPVKTDKGSILDGEGIGDTQKPFLTFADRQGKKMPFGVIWSTGWDLSNGVVVKASGLNSKYVKGVVDNTDIYKLMYLTLFGKKLSLNNKFSKKTLPLRAFRVFN